MTRLAALIAGVLLVPFFSIAQADPASTLLQLLANPSQIMAQASSTPVVSTTSAIDANDPRVITLIQQIKSLQGILTGLVAARLNPQTSALSPLMPPAPAPASALTRNLARGDRGDDVTQLQQFLIAQKLLSADSATGLDGLTPSGFFGALTEAAVKTFQCNKQIVCEGTPVATGYGTVGPKTRAALNGAMNTASIPLTSTPPSSISATPSSVLEPQCPPAPFPVLFEPCSGTWEKVKNEEGCVISWQCML